MEVLCTEYVETAARVLLLTLLVFLSVQDCRRRLIGIRLPCCMAAAGAIWLTGRAIAEETAVERILLELALALVPAVLFWLIAAATGQMGYGDGLVVATVGLWSGIWKCFFAVGISLFLMALFSACLLILHRVRRSTRIPYLPFLAAAYLLQIAI